MLQAYHDRGMNGAAVFEFFSRKLPRDTVIAYLAQKRG